MSDSTQPNQPTEPTQQTQEQPQEAPKPDINQRLLDELKSAKARAQELETKFKQREVEELTKNQQWQQLAELKENEAKAAIEERDRLKTAFVQKEKMSALREAALQAGLRKESIPDLRLLDFPEIKLESNGEGEFTAQGADKAIQRLKALRPHWFQSAVPNINTSSPVATGDGSTITYETVKKLQDDYSKNPNSANAEKLKGALLQFKKQRA